MNKRVPPHILRRMRISAATGGVRLRDKDIHYLGMTRTGTTEFGIDLIRLDKGQVNRLLHAFRMDSEVRDAYTSTQRGEYLVVEYTNSFVNR